MRAFIALEVSDRFRFEIEGLVRQLRNEVSGKFVSPDAYHVTLAFLGNVDERGVRDAISALETTCNRIEREIPLASNGLGKFGKARDATLWLGLKPVDPLMQAAENLRAELSASGLTFDSKPFKPHITLARRANLSQGALPDLPFPEPDCALAITLFKSELSSQGATYSRLFSLTLPGPHSL